MLGFAHQSLLGSGLLQLVGSLAHELLVDAVVCHLLPPLGRSLGVRVERKHPAEGSPAGHGVIRAGLHGGLRPAGCRRIARELASYCLQSANVSGLLCWW